MRKFFTFIAAMLFAGSMMAETAVLQYAGGTTTNMVGDEANNAETVGLDATLFTVTASKGAHSILIGLNKDGSIRLYGKNGNGNKLGISMVGGVIDSIALNIKQNADFTVKVINGTDSVLVQGTGNKFVIGAQKLSIQNVHASTQLQLNSITIYYTLDGSVLVKPTILPEETAFEKSVTVSMSAADGAKIYYTLDESVPTTSSTEYTAPFTLNATTIVKAIAAKGTQVSPVAEQRFFKLDTVGVTAARALIDANDADPHYVRGVLTGKPFIFGEASSFNGKIVFWMTDEANKKDSLEAYYVNGKNNEPWESVAAAVDEMQDGDTVLVYANKMKLHNNTTYEINEGYYAQMLGKFQEDPNAQYEHLTVAQAKAITDTLGDNGVSETKYFVEGYAVYADPYDALRGNQIFFMVDDKNTQDSLFEAYAATPKKDGNPYPVLNGDKVRTFGKLKKYIDTKNNNRVQLEIMDPTVEFLEEVLGDRTITIPTIDTISVDSALTIGKTLGADVATDKEYVIEGYISAYVNYFSEATGQATFWMTDSKESTAKTNAEKAFEVYNGKITPAEDPGLHAKVYVTAKIQNYKGNTIETSGSATVNVVEKGESVEIVTATVAEAVAIGNGLEAGAVTTKRYEIVGYVSNIKEMYGERYKNETFWISDTKGSRAKSADENAFLVYHGKTSANKEIGFDAKVRIIANIKKYNGDIENDGSSIDVEVLEEGIGIPGDTITVKEAVAKAQALVAGTQSDEFYYVKGYIAKVSTEYSTTNMNMSFYMTDKFNKTSSDFQCYRTSIAKSDVAKAVQGAYVISLGRLDNNSHGMQLATGGRAFIAPAPKIDTVYVNVAEAYAIGDALEEDAETDKFYGVIGKVAYSEEWNETYGTQTFGLSDLGSEDEEGPWFDAKSVSIPSAVSEDDRVCVYGWITKHTEDDYTSILINGGDAIFATITTDIEKVELTEKAQKVMINSVIYIIRDKKMFNIQGVRVR